MKNLERDMQHSHIMDLHKTKHFTTNPTPMVRKHHTTSSTYRGQQLLSTVQGKRLEVVSLCDIHTNEQGVVPKDSVCMILLFRLISCVDSYMIDYLYSLIDRVLKPHEFGFLSLF